HYQELSHAAFPRTAAGPDAPRLPRPVRRARLPVPRRAAAARPVRRRAGRAGRAAAPALRPEGQTGHLAVHVPLAVARRSVRPKAESPEAPRHGTPRLGPR